ncbi:WG repeat-containing protein [Actinoplanes aureus]|uniref:WG containing repeat-containing protein n=1 Tax=Actinoplanes aureus TaxID=2792083 RepID=A0A931G2F8_9ACTN|nr:WG repeat-containing protein [Actinoplanes aureus]MBG0568125.1 hypothetical protein [Actinoplanes aureus]
MNGWSSRPGADSWDDEPAWVYEITWEWEPLPGQRYPGDPGRRKAVHTPVYEASRGSSAPVSAAPISAAPVSGSAPVSGDGRGRGRASVGAAPVSPQPRPDEPSWNRPVHMHDHVDDRQPAPEQRRGSAPVYGGSARVNPVPPGHAQVSPASPGHPVPPGHGSVAPHSPSVPVSPGRPAAGRVPQQPQAPERGRGQAPAPGYGPRPGSQAPHGPARGGYPVPPAGPGGPRPAQHGGPVPPGGDVPPGRPNGPAPGAAVGFVPGRARLDQEAGYQGRRQAPEQQVPRQGPDGRPMPGPTSPAGPAYGSARPAPPDAFPAYPDEHRRDTTPFNLRPAPPERNTPATARPAPQPTRVTPQQMTPPAAVYPTSGPGGSAYPGAAHPRSGPGAPDVPVGWNGPGPVSPVSGNAPAFGRVDAPVSGSAPLSDRTPLSESAPVSGAGAGPIADGMDITPVSGPAGVSPVSGPAVGGSNFGPTDAAHAGTWPADERQQSGEPTRPLDPRRAGHTAMPGHAPPAEAGTSPLPEDQTRPLDLRRVGPETAEHQVERTQPIDPRRLGTHAADPHYSAPIGHGWNEPADAHPAAHAGYASAAEPVTAPPFGGEEATAPEYFTGEAATHLAGETAEPLADEAVAPVPTADSFVGEAPADTAHIADEGSAPAEESHGLGWLLSMSGLGATTPVPEAEAAPAPEAPAEPEPVPQGWFAPAIEPDEDADGETGLPAPEAAVAADQGSAELEAVETEADPAADAFVQPEAEDVTAAGSADADVTEAATVGGEAAESGETSATQDDVVVQTEPESWATQDNNEAQAEPEADDAWTTQSEDQAEPETSDTWTTHDTEFQAEPDASDAGVAAEQEGSVGGESAAAGMWDEREAAGEADTVAGAGVQEAWDPAEPAEAATWTEPETGDAAAPAEPVEELSWASAEPIATDVPPEPGTSEAGGVVSVLESSQSDYAETVSAGEVAREDVTGEATREAELGAYPVADEVSAAEQPTDAAATGPDTEVDALVEAGVAEPDTEAAEPSSAMAELDEEAAQPSLTAAEAEATEPGAEATELSPSVAGVVLGSAEGGPEAEAAEAGVVAAAGPVGAVAGVGGGEDASDERQSSEGVPPQRREAGDRRLADPERVLASLPWVFDPGTLRERIDEPERLWGLADRLTDRLEFAERDNVRAGLLSLRAVVHRVLGELDDALADGREGLRHAEASGELRPTVIARARLAHVLQWRGEFAEADRLYEQADSPELPSLVRAEIREMAGRSAFEQGRYLEAVNHFERALNVRQGEGAELVQRIELALDEITRRTGDGGWGPYPRTREEVLGLPQPPTPLRDDGTGLWGYAAAVDPQYAEAQPFSEGVAWVRRPDSAAWELIDQTGALEIAADAGYLAAGRFAEGLAWVSREPVGGWFAIDRANQTVVTGGFEDALPFRRGMALTRTHGVWGAIDRRGRIAVPRRYQRFATVLYAGGPVEGFTDEGLAVFEENGRFGVLDRTGRQVVPPAHAAVLIHPSAFLVSDPAGAWGALTREGEPLVDVVHREPADAAAEAERLTPETRPVL